jgi:hypothetical protein
VAAACRGTPAGGGAGGWTGQNGVQFTYPPFAAVIFAAASVLSWTAMRWAMTLVSLGALGLSLWLVFGALGYRDRPGDLSQSGLTPVGLVWYGRPPTSPPAASPGTTSSTGTACSTGGSRMCRPLGQRLWAPC